MMRTPYLIFLAALLVIAACGKKSNEDPLINKPTPPVKDGVIKRGQIVKMMSYNIHHANPPAKGEAVIDVAAIAAVINAENPDFVALQEVDKNTKRSGVNLNQAQELATRTKMNAFFSKSIDYDGGEYGVAVLSRYPILDRIRHQLPLADAAGGEARSVAIVSVAVEGGNGKVYFASTHLEVSNSASKKVQAQELLRINSGIQAPFFLAGDFNAVPTDEVISTLKQSFTAGCMAACPFTFPATSPSRTIDYIFLNQKASAEFVLQSYRTANDALASDHRAVVAELKYK